MKLETQKLKSYLSTNSIYYEKYLDSYKNKKRFLSWNWAAILVPQLWLAYRNLWGWFALILVGYSITLFLLYSVITGYIDVHPLIMIIVGVLSIAIILSLPFRANAMVLRRAEKLSYPTGQGKSNWWVVMIAGLLFAIPSIVLSGKLYVYQKDEIDQRTIALMSFRKNDSVESVKRMINSISTRNLSDEVAAASVCANSKEVLDLLEKRNVRFTEDAFYNAYNCSAHISIEYLIEEKNLAEPIFNETLEHALRIRRDYKTIEILLRDKKRIINQALLGYAIYAFDGKEQESMIDLLMSHDIDFNQPPLEDDRITTGPLRVAITQENIALVERLLEAGANPNGYLDYNRPIEHARTTPIEFTELLFKYGAEPNINAGWGSTLLEYAVNYIQLDRVKLLLENGANVTSDSLKEEENNRTNFRVNSEEYSDQERADNEEIRRLLNAYRSE